VAAARKLLPDNPFAWIWLNLEAVRRQPGVKAGLDPDATETQVTLLIGGLLDQFRKSPFLSAALAPNDGGRLLTFRTPRGREGIPEALSALHLPSTEQGGALPLLEPKGVLFSTSYVLDVKEFWEHRAKLMNAAQVKAFEEFDRNSGKFLGAN